MIGVARKSQGEAVTDSLLHAIVLPHDCIVAWCCANLGGVLPCTAYPSGKFQLHISALLFDWSKCLLRLSDHGLYLRPRPKPRIQKVGGFPLHMSYCSCKSSTYFTINRSFFLQWLPIPRHSLNKSARTAGRKPWYMILQNKRFQRSGKKPSKVRQYSHRVVLLQRS